jgi:hypothetical protein
MNELDSLIPSKKREKTREPDFGTYHHSTSVASKNIRAVVKAMFTDVFSFNSTKKFDIIVSNLVYHNFGKMRFKAYSHLSSWIRTGSFIVIGDLFFSPKTDMSQLVKTFKIQKQIKSRNEGFEQYALLVMSKD